MPPIPISATFSYQTQSTISTKNLHVFSLTGQAYEKTISSIARASTTGSTTPSEPALADITGASINPVAIDQQVVRNTVVKNNVNAKKPFVTAVEDYFAPAFSSIRLCGCFY